VDAHSFLVHAENLGDLTLLHVQLPAQQGDRVLPLRQALDDPPAPFQRD